MATRAKWLGLLATLAVAVSTVGIPSAPAAASSPAGRVTILLRAPHPAALGALARVHRLSHAQRVARLTRLVPSAAAVAAVTASLTSHGLRVTDETAWSITAIGSRSDLANAHLASASGGLPPTPPGLGRYVAAVLPTTGGAPVFHHAAATPVNGKGFRDAYAAKGKKPPGAGRSVDGKSTVATLQLANYDASDLTTYAHKQHLPNIVGTPRYRKVTVDGGPSASDDSSGGDVEVDLDQESILSAAPSARQRPYFAPNTAAGFIDVFANVFDDVVQNRHANGGGDPHIVALSTSWGGCEANDGTSQIRATQTVIKALVGAGVTVFASAGDNGIYDCGDSTGLGLGNSEAGVDYPASSPQVVGVGGTNLRHSGAKVRPNNGHNWRETGWSCSSPATCEGSAPVGLPVLPQGTGGTGGGESGLGSSLFSGTPFKGFAEPGYQRRSLHGSLFANQHHRLVPDIAADGDPQTGFDVYSSDPQVAGDENSQGLVQVGGTSLSSPVSAALFVNTLAAAGRHSGIGDIHAALYTAYRTGKHVFRDVTVGTNGAAADRGRDPSVSARRGYDTLTGLGGVFWPALTPYLLHRHRHHAR